MNGVNFLQRRRARFLIKRAQPFADEELVAVANFTWVGNSMGAQTGVRGRAEWAGGLPDWTLIGAGASRLFVIEAYYVRPDKGKELLGSWPLTQVRLTEESYDRKAGPIPLGGWRAIRFEFGDREPAVLQPFGREVDALLEAHRAAQTVTGGDGVRWDALTEVVLMTTSRGPFEDDVFFVMTFDDGSDRLIPLGEGQELLARLQALPGFDNETFTRAMAVSEEGVSVLWRR
jgi:hypothetical protein